MSVLAVYAVSYNLLKILNLPFGLAAIRSLNFHNYTLKTWMIYIHFWAIHNYVFVLLDVRRRSPNLQKNIYILHNVAHQKENSFGSKMKRVQT